MSEKVGTSLAGQLHAHAMASSGDPNTTTTYHAAASTATTSRSSVATVADDSAPSSITAQLNFKLLPADSLISSYQDVFGAMNTSQISNASTESANCSSPPMATVTMMPPPKPSRHMAVQPLNSKSCRFPKLEECAHFHYERVQLGPLLVQLVEDKSEQLGSSIASQSIGGDLATSTTTTAANLTSTATPHSSLRSFSPDNCWFIIRVSPQRCESFLIKRSFENMQMFDEMLHRCVYDRKISGLRNMQELQRELHSEIDVDYAVARYLERFSKIASDSLTCGTILTWLQLDNKGRRLPLADGETQRTINTPAVGAAYGVRRYQAQAPDEINIEVGDMISVIDMPSPAESIWWRGKKSHLQKSLYEVGFFPQSCVATIGDKVPRNFPMPAPLVGHLDASPTKPVLRKHGKLIAFFRSFILSRPSRRRLKQSGIYRERVFSCDLSEHLLNSGQDIPMVLKSCAEFIENYGIIDGIYRLSGITSNIQRLRRAFDEERVPDLGNPEMKQDIHAVSSLLKMYFRELPNPLCTYQLYDNFVEAIQVKADEADERLRLMKETVLKLPPPHYRTLKYLAEHLHRVSQHHGRTNMTDKNLAIVWAPNLLRSPALESGGVAALRGVGVQAVVTEYLIRNCHNIFDALEDQNAARLSYVGNTSGQLTTGELRLESLTDCESLLVEQREQDQSIGGIIVERPKSLSTGGAKLISLEEAQERHSRIEACDLKQSMPISMIGGGNAANIGSYIEVGGGPSSLPDKYHTVLSVPSTWHKRKPDKTPSWKSIFTRTQRPTGGANDLSKSVGDAQTVNNKEIAAATRVTFVEEDQQHLQQQQQQQRMVKHEKPKSIELLETTRDGHIMKPMELCVRSSSIDSLRTIGHSRSVSHDSYFDLQSPQRGHMTTCPSRELSELGLNFDREEPDMRIFSESESVVSSPRVGKENVPPSSGCPARRILRARPEDFSSQTNSVNPSPKKQPRLNLLSPSSARTRATTEPTVPSSCGHTSQDASAENCCKRYKLEDQLSDIQYIDCSTPDHGQQPQQLFANVEVHPPPKPARSTAAANTIVTQSEVTSPIARYSYPSVQLGAKRKEQQVAKERYSYQGTFTKPSQQNAATNETISRPLHNGVAPIRVKLPAADELSGKLGPPTPTTPAHSPRYSLLLCETESSENSSAVNTPQYDLEPLMISSVISGVSGVSSNMQQQLLLGVDAASSYLGSSHESLGQHFIQNEHEQRDMNALKRELSLDLQPLQPRQPQAAPRAATLPIKEQLQAAAAVAAAGAAMSSPNNSNFTDNTSQSVTPSEFGYQHLQRQLSMHSLLATEESSPIYEDYESQSQSQLQTPSNAHKLTPASPIKSTISITYNLKSPERERKVEVPPPKSLLETNFDENIVYEQLKTFRNSVTEVNQLLSEQQSSLKQIQEEDASDSKAVEMTEQLLRLADSLELQHDHDYRDKQLLYENIELRKPKTVYENLRGEEMKLNVNANVERLNDVKKLKPPSDKIELDSLESIKQDNDDDEEEEEHHHHHQQQQQLQMDQLQSSTGGIGGARKSPSFSVKQLANKFESSPVEQLPNFDFSVRGGSMKKPNEVAAASKPVPPPPPPVALKKLNANAQKITRSLDENAFVREFGGKVLQDLSKLPELPELCNRRKSFDFTRPKTLNPPKRLPGMSITEEICMQRNDTVKLPPEQITPTTENRISLIQQNNMPTKDQQQHQQQQQQQQQSMVQLNVPGRKSVLTGVKLDRERIDKIKEERRQQLTQKYYGDSLKSRSKTELNSSSKEDDNNFQAMESLRVKSKSRGDMRTLQKDMDMDMNLKQLARAAAGSESTLHTKIVGSGGGSGSGGGTDNGTTRVRSISDEKNQNCDTNNAHGNSVKSTAQKYTANRTSSATIPPLKLDRKSMPLRSTHLTENNPMSSNNSSSNNREKISPQFSIRDVTAMFESRSQNQ